MLLADVLREAVHVHAPVGWAAFPERTEPVPLRIGRQATHNDFRIAFAASALPSLVRTASQARQPCR
jgi:hypothetical protein